MRKWNRPSGDPRLKRSLLLSASVAGLALLLASVALVRVCRLDDLYPSDPQGLIGSDSEGEVLTRPASFIEKDLAAETPRVALDVGGLLLKREDNRLVVGTGNLFGFLVGGDTPSASHWELGHDGPTAEVVTTNDTIIYRDDTFRHLTPRALSGPVRQVLTCQCTGSDRHEQQHRGVG
jgi:hypothetical protein